MILSHLALGFITSYIGYTPPSMLNITASKIRIENNKRIARQFILGASVIVLLQVIIAISLLAVVDDFPFLIIYIKKSAILVFAVLSFIFLKKAFSKTKPTHPKLIKNGFLFGLSLSSINMFAIPFFAIAHSSFVMHNWVSTNITCTSYFGIGTVLGTFVVLNNYVYLAQKWKSKLTSFTKYFNLIIGSITGFVAIFSAIKLYF